MTHRHWQRYEIWWNHVSQLERLDISRGAVNYSNTAWLTMKGSCCGLHINTINIECLQAHCTDYTFSSVTQLLEKKCSLSDVFDACLSYCYTTSKQTNERSLQFYLQLWKAARSPNLSSLAPGCSPKSHSSDSLRLPVPGNLLQPWTNPQKDTLITRAHTYTATFRGNKSLRQTSGTTHQTGRFLLNAAIFDKLSRLQEWLRCNINLQAAIKKDCETNCSVFLHWKE